jgi:hypothetical protein
MTEADPALAIAAYRPFSLEGLAASVRRGEFQNPKWMYASTASAGLWQGDVLPRVALAWINRDGRAEGYRGPAMLLSHGCDTELDRDLVSSFAPALPLDRYLEMLSVLLSPADLEKRAENIRLNQILNNFYLPAFGKHPERVVDFSFTGAVSNVYVNTLAADTTLEEKLRLTRSAWYLLTAKLSGHVSHIENVIDYPREL